MKTLTFILLAFAILNCSESTFDREVELRKILEMHNLQKEYHFNKQKEEFANQLSSDFISINRGDLKQLSYDEHIAQYEAYFSSVSFLKWDDTEDPIIRFSKDGKLAYTIVQKDVIVQYADDTGKMTQDSTHFAWTAIYRKGSDGWKIEHVASTNSPTEITN